MVSPERHLLVYDIDLRLLSVWWKKPVFWKLQGPVVQNRLRFGNAMVCYSMCNQGSLLNNWSLGQGQGQVANHGVFKSGSFLSRLRCFEKLGPETYKLSFMESNYSLEGLYWIGRPTTNQSVLQLLSNFSTSSLCHFG